MHLILRDRMRADGRVDHRTDEQDRWVAPEILTHRRGGGVVFGAVIDMGMIGGVGVCHAFSPPSPSGEGSETRQLAASGQALLIASTSLEAILFRPRKKDKNL